MQKSSININLNNFRNNEFIDCLPGIFYVYRLIEGQFKLVHWNKNHETLLGYTSNEIKEKNVFEFVYEKDFLVMSQAIEEIIRTGKVKQVFLDVKTKQGFTIPFICEGYQFLSEDSICFLGVGIDISSFVEAQKKLIKLENELFIKNKELFGFTVQNAELYRAKKQIRDKLDKLQSIDDLFKLKLELKRITKNLVTTSNTKELWEVFRIRFNQVNQDFFQNLQEQHPSLSNSELKYCAFLKIKLSPNQISSLLNITKEAIKKKRYRIRQKIGLLHTESLDNYINKF